MRHKLFWAMYFVCAALLVTVLVLRFSEHIIFNWFSLFPICYMILNILYCFFILSPLFPRFLNHTWEMRRIRYHGGEVDAPYSYYNRPIYIYSREFLLKAANLSAAFLPFWPLFILFFNHIVKILSWLFLFFMIFAIHGIYHSIDMYKKAKKERLQHREELKKQISREQEGKWR